MNRLEELIAKQAELELQIKQARKEAEDERKRQMAKTKRVWTFELRPLDKNESTWYETWDPMTCYYTLIGRVQNKEECKAAGYSDDAIKGGSMSYLFNNATGKFICSSGGGTLFIVGTGFTRKPAQAGQLQQALGKLEQFIAENPRGGFVTDIIVNQEGFSWS